MVKCNKQCPPTPHPSPHISVLPLISLAPLLPQLSLCATELWSSTLELSITADHWSCQTWPSCFVIRSEDLHSAYQSAPPADYLSKRAETKAVNTENVGSGFSTGARMAACSLKKKTKFQSSIHSVGYTVLIMESSTSQHANLLLPEPSSVFPTGVGENSIYCYFFILSQALRSIYFLFEIEKTKSCFNNIVLDDVSVFWHWIELEYETEAG